MVATLVLGTGAGGLHTCTFAHSKDSPAGAANRASVRRMAASLTIPWARKHKCTVKEAMMFANQSKEARLEMLS